MSRATVEQVAALANRWEQACRAADNDCIVTHLSDDVKVWYNFDREKWHDRAGYKAILDESLKTFWNQRYSDMRFHVHEGGFVEQATLTGDTHEGTAQTSFLLIATVRDGKITRIEEYLDTALRAIEGEA